MSDIMDKGANRPVLCLAWETFCQNPEFWNEGCCTAHDLAVLLYRFGGREPCERLALYWNQHGRDDIAAKVKSIIHQGDEKLP